MDETAQADAAVIAAERTFAEHLIAANDAKAALFDAYAQSVKAGRTPEDLATRATERRTPEEIKAGATFSAAYIRRQIRERGVGPLRTGPKPRGGV
jgi:hypothetical protein